MRTRLNLDSCYDCLCKVCTGFRCPYSKGRCQSCMELEFRRLYDCDFFENRRTAPKRFRIVRKANKRQDLVNAKLDAILEALQVPIPKPEHSGTYGVYYDGLRVYRGSYDGARAYIQRAQPGLRSQLVMQRLRFSIDADETV